MASNMLERFQAAMGNRKNDPDLDQALTRAGSYRPVVWADGKWRLGGLITYLQLQYDVVRAVDPSLPVGIHPDCLDPVRIAKVFGIPLEEFDCYETNPLTRIEHKLDALVQPQRQQVSEPVTAPQPASQPLIQFRRTGTGWHCRFEIGDTKEEGHFAEVLGFRCWAVLLDNPGRQVEPEELERLANLPPPRFPRNTLVASRGRLDADADTREVVLDADDTDESGAGFGVPKAQKISDKRTVRELDQEIARLEQELAATINPERRQEIQQQIANNQNWRGKLVNRRGRVRPMISPGAEQARKRVRNLLDRARAAISKEMPHLGQYLALAEDALEYDPTKGHFQT
jgi:hypothetical protein